MNKKQPKKKSINVQLTKDDLKELLVVLKNFMVEEISGHSRVTTHRIDCHNSRITQLERIELYQKPKRILHCAHEDKLDCITYSRKAGTFLTVDYKCMWCGRVDTKMLYRLTRKEKRALRRLGVKL